MLNPSRTLSIKEILRLKDGGKINNPCLPHMKGIRNTKGTTLYISFMLGGHCDFTDPCGYHLQVNDTERLHGTSNTDYKPFHNYLEANK